MSPCGGPGNGTGPGSAAGPWPGPPIRAHTAFDAVELASRARGAGEVISVVIPARNEEATVGEVVATVHDHLVSRVGLVHEVLVVDADSADATGAVAAAAGARVVRQSEVLPHLGSAPGKGEAMWKGLAAATGSLVVYLDADVVDVGPHFVTGLLGPLLHERTVQLTKAAYDRPFVDTAGAPHGTGGRVTELLARPVLAAWFPQLAGIVQPLAGEIGARRSLLASLPFVRGYGVELAMLVDVAHRHGIDAIAQVDLGVRTHDHQELTALSRMAAELFQVALARRGGDGSAAEPTEEAPPSVLWQPQRTPAGTLELQAHAVEVTQRPPLAEVQPG